VRDPLTADWLAEWLSVPGHADNRDPESLKFGACTRAQHGNHIGRRHVNCLSRLVVEAIGWLSSLILLTTIIAQLRKQWADRSTRGVSKWLFVGQTAASLGFTVYSVLVNNWVFVVTNGLMLLSALLGCFLTLRFAAGSRAHAHDATEPER
jgi:uncharacterized protein with PQ loop repeat